ncbi:type II toxin-antitoxin system VapC family toxin [Planktothrix mougeotii]|uniref:Type II toxin-antitoxin system VapC family toxin n=1 Tax=Planktothrix mougeotii LEGE 06226 TaxID=1828728 RepID=A0ABR9U5I9_9CYAN|nr:type II toxin-antitoxin system VapC family toxin [Planktothrix mougeotii]MBE9141714.1 type II toxin-antitoxin system VapC family toxin [Planktothrix mougeotii LEGE 06226]
MKYLLDTHTFLWFVNDSEEISEALFNLLESDVDLLLSIASLWEIAIKVNIGKLSLPKQYAEFMTEQIRVNDIEIVPVSLENLNHLSTLPLHHKDPFDRLIIAQGLTENLTIISKDSAFNFYEIKIIWI